MVAAGNDNNRARACPCADKQCCRLLTRFLLRLGITAAALWIAAEARFFARLGSAILASIVVSIVSVTLSLVLPDGR
jgi:uncharacterized membrane protein YvlD (DUF360 family)